MALSPFSDADLRALAERWGLAEIALFGSILRDDFRPESDIDVLIRPKPGVVLTFGEFLDLEAELQRLAGRKVDLVDRTAVEESHNWLRRRAILESARTVYAA
ncbi:MAG: nucleotidyltransferase family protein [Dehalococcoidia bacterium]